MAVFVTAASDGVARSTGAAADTVSNDEATLLRYCVQQSTAFSTSLSWRDTVLRLALSRYEAMSPPDYVAAVHCLLHLADADGVARMLLSALGGDATSSDGRRLAFQLAFELEDNASQQFLAKVSTALVAALPVDVNAAAASSSAATTASSTTTTTTTSAGGAAKTPMSTAVAQLKAILSGRASVDLYLEFLYRNCRSDLTVLRNAKAALDQVITEFLCVFCLLV